MLALTPLTTPQQNVIEAPHVMILGAGASVAACPKGDKNGRRLPVMRNLVEVVGLSSLMQQAGVGGEPNFELAYSRLCTDAAMGDLRTQIENQIADYFDAIEIPRHVTIYDEIILSLRRKDLIATFNWDPLLVQAYWRHRHSRERPRLAFLHGNVAIGTCLKDRENGYIGGYCTRCSRSYERTPLLFPVAEKNYASNPFIAAEWDVLRHNLQSAYLVTIFGYSAPLTDAAAFELMMGAWSKNKLAEFAEIEIVDVRPRRELEKSWQPFFTRDHYRVRRRISGTMQYAFPRRSCDAFAGATLYLQPWHETRLPRFRRVESLRAWCAPYEDDERAHYEKQGPLHRPTRTVDADEA